MAMPPPELGQVARGRMMFELGAQGHNPRPFDAQYANQAVPQRQALNNVGRLVNQFEIAVRAARPDGGHMNNTNPHGVAQPINLQAHGCQLAAPAGPANEQVEVAEAEEVPYYAAPGMPDVSHLMPLIIAKDVNGLAGQLTNMDVAAIKNMPCINATGQISSGKGRADEQGWKGTVALTHVLLHCMNREQFAELAAVSETYPELTSGDWENSHSMLTTVYSRSLRQLERIFTAVVPEADLYKYVKVAAFMIVGRLMARRE